MNDAAGVADGVRREVETMVKAQAERFIMDMDLVKREDFDALRELVQAQSEEIEALKAEVAALKAEAQRRQPNVKVAVISDVHGNRLALEAVLDDIARQGVDATFNLGDLVSGPLEPSWTADILMELDFPTMRGNHERMLIDKPPEKLGPVDRFAQEQMESRHRAWLDALPATLSCSTMSSSATARRRRDDEPWLDNWWDGRTRDAAGRGDGGGQGRGLRLSGAAVRAHAYAARGAAAGWAADRQSGQRRAAVQPRLARCALRDRRAARRQLVPCVPRGALRSLRRRPGRRRPMAFRNGARR